jgi:ubiquinol-cytochrome c reductase cytochrome b subunit
MIAIGFLGYVLPYGQMSLWGLPKLAPNAYFLFYKYILLSEYLSKIIHVSYLELALPIFTIMPNSINSNNTVKLFRIRADKRIGPHNKNVLSIIFGSLLGDGHAEKRIKGNGTRITFYQEGIHISYLI